MFAVLFGVPLLTNGWRSLTPPMAMLIAVAAALAIVVRLVSWRLNRNVRDQLRQLDRNGVVAWPITLQVPGARPAVGVLALSNSGISVTTKRGEVALQWADVTEVAADNWMLGFWFRVETQQFGRLSLAVLTDSTLQGGGPRANRQCIATLRAAWSAARATV